MNADSRSGVDILLTQQTLLEDILAELRRSNTTAREGAVSSIAIEDMAKGPPKITTKVYQGSPLATEDLVAALSAHQIVHAEAEARSLDGWKLSVDHLLEAAQASAVP